MKIPKLEAQLQDYLDGACSDAERAEVESLLASDPKAQALFEEMRSAHDALQLLRERPTPEVPMDQIQLGIAGHVFAGRPEPDMQAWGNTFYKRLAAAAVLLCGLSLGLFVHEKFSGAPDPEAPTAREDNTPDVAGLQDPGEITALELINRNRVRQPDGGLVTFTPTDSVEPTFEIVGREGR